MGTGIRGDYTGFSFGDIRSEVLGITHVSGGDRYSMELLPSFQDKTVDVPGGDGTYYFGSLYKNREFSLDIAYDEVTEEQLRMMVALFSDRQIKPLVFDEYPYKTYYARVSSSPKFDYVAFDTEEELEYEPYIWTNSEVEKKEIFGDSPIEAQCLYIEEEEPFSVEVESDDFIMRGVGAYEEEKGYPINVNGVSIIDSKVYIEGIEINETQYKIEEHDGTSYLLLNEDFPIVSLNEIQIYVKCYSKLSKSTSQYSYDSDTKTVTLLEIPPVYYSFGVPFTLIVKYKVKVPKIISQNVPKRIYKGEATIEFVCYDPYAHCGGSNKYLDNYSDLHQWNEVYLPLLTREDLTGFDIYSSASGEGDFNGYKLYNPGDIEAFFTLRLEFNQNGKIAANVMGIDDNSKIGWEEISKENNEDTHVMYDSKLHLFYGLKAITEQGITKYKKTGSVYNRYIDSGDFFNIPISQRESNGDIIAINLSFDSDISNYNPNITYDYLYF